MVKSKSNYTIIVLNLFFALFISLVTVNAFADSKQIGIEVSPASETPTDSLSATSFGISLAGWVNSHETVDSLPKGIYEPSFEALQGAFLSHLKIWRELQAKKDNNLNSAYMNQLLSIQDAGYLDEYIWVNHVKQKEGSFPKSLKIEKFQGWAKAHLQGHQPRMEAILKIE